MMAFFWERSLQIEYVSVLALVFKKNKKQNNTQRDSETPAAPGAVFSCLAAGWLAPGAPSKAEVVVLVSSHPALRIT